ncbi:MAG: ABC transporter permease subunit [Coriobacteriales bacterium]|jgi:phosphonate transport system permease protein|nr:ABC transporter permease subunit [Coriobacteriales bacterium]
MSRKERKAASAAAADGKAAAPAAAVASAAPAASAAAVASAAPAAAAVAVGGGLNPSGTARLAAFFHRRTFVIIGVAVGLVLLNLLTGNYLDFDLVKTLIDVPAGLAWMFVNFIPSVESLAKLPTILNQLAATVLVSIAASCLSALLALVFAVLGSRSVGVGGPAQLIVRAIASLFRNIPTVAWALILLFSFKQSEFTGFLALFLTSFGYLMRCFLESIDEVSGGAVEALRATGASYGQIIAQAVIPLCSTVVLSWILYMIETNVRDATLIGILTGTGIGFVFDLYYKSFNYAAAGLVVIAIVIVVISLELTSNFIRRAIL